jgi:peptidoglycan/xylan/chitin deacetylase (PgdA/CDA1 family)
MRARLFLAVVLLVPLTVRASFTDRPHYIAVAFHDVVDRAGDGDENSVTADRLVAFFEWLRGNGWTAITLDDIAGAQSGARPLPDRAILITFDDGFRSLYTRVYPLLLAYKIPIVAGLVGNWMGGPARETVRKGDDVIPGSSVLISWEQAREMARSGLVEFASHSFDLHHSELANPQGSEMPAAAVRAYAATGGYETETSYRRRIRADLEQSRALLQKELGVGPRALVWPYGRYTQAAREEALAANYRFLLTLDPEPGFLEDLPNMPRILPFGNTDLRSMVSYPVAPPTAVRLVHLNPQTLSPMDAAAFETNLGATIERLRTLGATTVVVDAAWGGSQGRLEGAWFPNRVLPMKSDVLSRIVWQLRTRAGVNIAVSLPVSDARAALGNDDAVVRLFEDLGYSAIADALLLDHVQALAAFRTDDSSHAARWDVRRRRNSLDKSRLPASDDLALRAFVAFEHVRPGTRLFLLTPTVGDSPSAIADLTLVETPLAVKPFGEIVNRLVAGGWMQPNRRYSSGVWVLGEKPPSASALSTDARLFQRRGGVAFGWDRDDPLADEPKAALAAPAVSAATFPILRKP